MEIEGTPTIVVVGAGIMGLSCAIRLQEVAPDVRVVVIADRFPPDTTSNIAGAIVRPDYLGDTPSDRVLKWTEGTFARFWEQYRAPDAANIGLSLVSAYEFTKDQSPPPFWAKSVEGFRPLSKREMSLGS